MTALEVMVRRRLLGRLMNSNTSEPIDRKAIVASSDPGASHLRLKL